MSVVFSAHQAMCIDKPLDDRLAHDWGICGVGVLPGDRSAFGDLVDQPRFREAYLWTLDSLHRHGARTALEALIGTDES